MRSSFGHYVLAVLFLFIYGCGGGGGGDGDGNGGGDTPIPPSSVSFTTTYLPFDKTLAPVPSGWEQTLFADPEILAAYSEPQQGPGDQYRDSIIFARAELGGVPDLGGISNIRQISTRARNIDGFAAQETVFDADVEDVPVDLRFMEVVFQQDEATALGLVYVAERSRFDRNVEIARYVAGNMRVGQVVMSDFSLSSDLEDPGKTPIATDGNNFLVVSCRESSTFPYPADLVAQLISADRQKIGDEIVILSGSDTSNTGCWLTRPEITFDGSNYLVTYMGPAPENRFRQILANRISPAGVLLDSDPINVSNSSGTTPLAPIAIYTGSNHMVLWHDDDNAGSKRILGALVTPDGVVSPAFTVFDDLEALYPQQVNTFAFRPYVARASDRIMVAIEPRFAFDVRQPERPVYAQILDLNGTTLLPAPLLVREDSGGNPRYVQVSSDGQSFLVTWVEGVLETNTNSTGTFGIYGRQIGTNGQLINGDASTLGLEIEAPGSMAIEELNVSFIDGRYSVLWSSTAFGTDYGIYAKTVSSDLTTITSTAPVAGTRDAAPQSMPRETTPDVAATVDTTLYVIISRAGTIDVWRSPD